jgi:hypothetical protein
MVRGAGKDPEHGPLGAGGRASSGKVDISECQRRMGWGYREGKGDEME